MNPLPNCENIDNFNIWSEVVKQSVDSIVVTDTNSAIIYMNKAAEHLFGWSFEELKGRKTDVFNAEQMSEEIQKEIYDTVASGKIYNGELLNKKKDGTYFYVQIRISPIYDKKGNIIAYMGSQRDITNLKQTEKRLQQEREFLDKLIQTSPVAIHGIDPQGNVIIWNESSEKIFGWRHDEVMGKPLPIIPKEKINEHLSLRNRVLAGETITGYEVCRLRKNGSYLYGSLSVAPMYDQKGNIFGIMANMEDITEKKQYEYKLKEAFNQLESIHFNLPISVWSATVDENGDFVETYISEGVNELLALPPNTIGNDFKAFFNYVKPHYLPEIKDKFEEGIKSPDKVVSLEYEVINGNNEIRWFLSSGRAQEESDKIKIYGSTIDITKNKNAEKSLINAKLLAENANRSKTEFLANVSHELRTPLNAIIGFSQILSTNKSGNLNDKELKYVSNILKSGDHLLELINKILDISKLQAGKEDLEIELVNFAEICEGIKPFIDPLIARKDLSFECILDCTDTNIKADKIKMLQIMHNLLGNAIKFTPENGSIAINTKWIDDNFQVSVRDTGIGIPETSHKNIFNNFKQVDSSATRKYEGAGLGLALVKSYVEMHGGDIWVESEVGKGSTFTFVIPQNQSS
jgi:PAS domain S-box-containing protein